MMRVDAHQHLWLLAARQGAWPPPELAVLYRDFAFDDLEPLLRKHDVRRTVLVQSLPNEADSCSPWQTATKRSARWLAGLT